MRFAIPCILLLSVMASAQYRTHPYDTTKALVDSLLANYPSIIEKRVLGTSVQGRELFAVKISDNVGVNETEPEISFDAGCHGNELVGQEMIILLMRDLCALYGTDTQITRLVDTREVWVYPHVNPDGRTNMTRENARYVNLNRDFGYLWDNEGGSAAPFSQPETKAYARWFLDRHCAISQSNHDGRTMITYPWGNRAAQPKDLAAYHMLASAYASQIGSAYGFGGQYATMYQVTGFVTDFCYGSRGFLSFIVEVSLSGGDTLSCPSYYAKHKPAMLYMAEQAGRGVWGVVTDSSTGEPVSASLWMAQDGVESFPVYDDPAIGDYHKVVLPGAYTVTAFSNGYGTAVKTGVLVSDTGAARLDFRLSPSTDADRYGFQVMGCRVPGILNSAVLFQDSALTPRALGRPDGRNYSLGKGGYVVIDMGDTLDDLAGPDLRIIEGDASMEGYSVQVSLDPWSTLTGWQTIGRDSGSASFDLADSGMASFRYVCIRDDDDDERYAAHAGFDLDAVAAIRTPDATPPSAPALLSALSVDAHTVRLAWSKSVDDESGIARYRVYRNDTLVLQTADTACVNAGLSDNTLYAYTVEAMNTLGGLSGKSNAVQVATETDGTLPSLVSVRAWYALFRIDLLYSEPVEEASAEEPSNYALTGGVAIDSAVLSADHTTVRFKLAGGMVENASCTLSVSNVRDRARAPNTIAPNSQISFTCGGVPDSIGFIQAGTDCDADISYWRALRLIIPSGMSGVVQSVAFRHVAAGGQIRYGVYANSGDVPGLCMDSTDWRDASPGWQKIDLTRKDFIVGAGDTIWISVRASAASAVLCYSNSGTGTHARSISNSNGSGLPTPWVSANVAYTDYCGYAVIQSSGTRASESGIVAEGSPEMRACPNPFNPTTVLDIRYRMPGAGRQTVDLKVFSVNGRLVKDLSFTSPSSSSIIHRSVRWDASGTPSGLYLARVKIGGTILRKQLVLVK